MLNDNFLDYHLTYLSVQHSFKNFFKIVDKATS